uniref:PAX-interacting protein 1 n=1 Tax=Trichobilharzia regenti TaxID=157069 RepID=A0AA85KFB1_TRIRE|nr:unnamed protein product [Trichobilharzia regenti]
MEPSVFKDAKFFIISCDDKEVVDLLKSSGAVSHPFLSESIRFAISDDPSLAEVGEAEELYAVPVVTSRWVKLSAEAQKFLPFRPFHPDFKQIFKGTKITCSGLGTADRLAIWAHVVIHGGEMSHYLDNSVTHVVVAKATGNFYDYVTTMLTNDSTDSESNTKPVLVTPDWIVDCLAQNSLLACESYHPNLLVRRTPPPSQLPSPSSSKQMSVKQQQQLNEPKESDMHKNSNNDISLNSLIKQESNLIINSTLSGGDLMMNNNHSYVTVDSTSSTVNPNINTNTITTNTAISNILNCTNNVQQQQSSQIITSKQNLVQNNQIMHTLQSSSQQLSSVLSGGTNVQAATGLSVQQINMRAVEQKAKYDGVTPSRPGRGGHSRGGGSGRGSSKKATQDQSRSGNQQQQQQQRFSISSPLANRNPVAQNIAAPQRFPVSGAQGSVNQRFPSGLPIYTDPTVQQGMVQQITGSDIIGNSNSSGSNYSGCSMPGNHTNVILSNSFLPISANSAISSGALSITTPTTNLISISSNSTSSTGHHAKTSKSKSSKHMQEQNLNEEEKDAIVMQNVKNILSLQHTWNRESSHGRGSSSATSSSDNHSSSNNSGHGQNGPNSLSGLQGGNSSSLGNLITSGYGGSSSNLGSSQTSGNHRKPKSPKSPCRAVGSTMGHKVSPKSPKNAKVTGITKTLPAPHQQHIQQQQQQQQQQPQQQPSIVMAGCAGSALPSVLLTGSLQQMQYRPASNNSLQGTPSQLQRSTSMQHYLTTATLASHQPQSAPGTPAYIVQRHPCGQLVASVSQQSTHGQLHTQSFPVQNPYQRASGILTAVNTSNLGQQQHQQSSQQNQASVQHFQHAAQIQQPTLFVRTTRQPYQQNENIDAQPDMATIISSDGSGDILLTSNHNPHQHHNHNPHQISASNIIQSSSNHLYQSNHQSGHNSAIEQTHSHNKQTVNSQPITQQLLLQSTGGNGGGGGGSATIGVGNGSQLIQIKSTAYTSPIQQTLLSETNHQQQQHHMVASVASSSINNSQSTPAMIIDNRTPHQQQMISQSNCSITTTPTSTPHHHHQQQSVQLHIALHSPGNNTSSLNTGTPGGGGGNTSGNQIKSSPSNLISQHSSMVGGKMSQLQQQIQTQSSPTRPSVNNRQYVQQQPQHQQPQIQHQYSASLATHPAQHYQQHQQQPQQQKIQLSPATATIPAQYQAIHGCYTPQPQQSQQQQQQQQPHQNQHPQQIIFQSPTGQQIIAAQHQSVPNAFARNSNNPTPSGGMLLRSVLPCSGNANTPGNGFHQNQSSLVTVSTNQRPVPQMTNRPQTNKVLFQTSPTPQSNNNNISIHGLQQQAIHQQHQQPIPTYPQQVHSGGIITGQQSKPNHQMVYAQSAGRQNTQVIIGDSSSVSVINAPNQHHQTNTIHSPYHHVATPNLVHGNGFDHSISPRPTHPQVVPMPSHSHSSTATTVSANVQTPPRPNQIPVTTVVQSVNRQITCNSTPGNTQNTPTLMTPMQLTPAYHGHDGNPLPSRPEECLIGCVMLILGYRSVPESQKVVWRRVMRLHGAEVVLAYDPTRVTHVVIDCQLEEPDVIKQALLDQKRLVTIYWVNDILAKGRMIPPFEILHLPSPFSKEITFSFIRSQIISLTGFEGKDRQKIEVIIRQIGATFTDYLEPSNTLLVCKQPSGKKYEMAQLWGIPCINMRWLQDLYFGDLHTLSLAMPHKYLCFETSDVTMSLERCTPRVQDLMVGWQTPIRLTQEVWIRSTKLSHDFANEERERKRKLELENNSNNSPAKVKKSECLLPALTEEDIKIAMSCRPRYETLLQEAEQKRELLAAIKSAAAETSATGGGDSQNTIPENESNPPVPPPLIPTIATNDNNGTPNMSVETVDDDDDNIDSGVTTYSVVSHESKVNIDDNEESSHPSCSITSSTEPTNITVEVDSSHDVIASEQDISTIKMDCHNSVYSTAQNASNNAESTCDLGEKLNCLKSEEVEKEIHSLHDLTNQNNSDNHYHHHQEIQQNTSTIDSFDADLSCNTLQTQPVPPISENIQNLGNIGDDVDNASNNNKTVNSGVDSTIQNVTLQTNTNLDSVQPTYCESNNNRSHDQTENAIVTNKCDSNTPIGNNNDNNNNDTVSTMNISDDIIMSTVSSSDSLSNDTKNNEITGTVVNKSNDQTTSKEDNLSIQQPDVVTTSTTNITSSAYTSANVTVNHPMIISDENDENIQNKDVADIPSDQITSALMTTKTTTVTPSSDSNIQIDQSNEDIVRKRLATSPIDNAMDCKRRAVETNPVDSTSTVTMDICSNSSTSNIGSNVLDDKSSSDNWKGDVNDDKYDNIIPVSKTEENADATTESLTRMDDEDIVDDVIAEESSLKNADTSDRIVRCDTGSKIESTEKDTSKLLPPICTDIRITFTAIDLESRLTLTELCLQLPDCKIVDSAEEATHLVANRLIRTPKTYMAVALGCYVVTPKWIQASVMCGYWLDEKPWILSDPDSEAQLGIDLKKSISIARKRQMIGPEAGLFAGLEFWFSPGACHREMCMALIRAGHGIVRQRRPTQKMALLAQPKQLIICHEDDSHVANYLMRTKTGNKAVHHEEFILSGTLRQELDFDAYQIQYVNALRNGLKAAVAAAAAAFSNSNNNNNTACSINPPITVIPPPTSLRFGNTSSVHSIHNAIILPQTSSASSVDGNIPHGQLDTSTAIREVHLSSPINLNNSNQQLNVPSSYQTVSVSAVSKTSQSSVPTEVKSLLSSNNNNRNTTEDPHPYSLVSAYKSSNDTQSFLNHPQITSSETPCQPVISSTISRLVSVVPTITKADTNLSYLLSRSSNTLDQIPTTNLPITTSSLSSYALSSTVSPTTRTSSQPQQSLSASRQDFVNIQSESGITGLSHSASSKSISDLIISVCTMDACVVTNPLLSSSNNNNNGSTSMLPPKSSVTAYISGLDNNTSKRHIIGSNRSSSLLLTGVNPVSDTFLSSIPSQDMRQTIIHRPVTPLTAMIVAAESGVGDLMNPLPIGDTDDAIGSVPTFIIPKSNSYRSQISGVSVSPLPVNASVNLNARIAAADANAVASATAAAASALSSSNNNNNSNSGKSSSSSNNTDILSKTVLGLSVSTPGLSIRSPRSTILTNNPLHPSELIDTSSRHILTNIQQTLTKPSSQTPSADVTSLDVVKTFIKSQVDGTVHSSNIDCDTTITASNNNNMTTTTSTVIDNNTNNRIIISSTSNVDITTSTDSFVNCGSIQPFSSGQQSSNILISTSVLNTKDDLVNFSNSFTPQKMDTTSITTTTAPITLDLFNPSNLLVSDGSGYFTTNSTKSSPTSTLCSSNSDVSILKEQSSDFLSVTDFKYEINISRNTSISNSNNNNSENADIYISNVDTTNTNTTVTCTSNNDKCNSIISTTPLTDVYYPHLTNDNTYGSNNTLTFESVASDIQLVTSSTTPSSLSSSSSSTLVTSAPMMSSLSTTNTTTLFDDHIG